MSSPRRDHTIATEGETSERREAELREKMSAMKEEKLELLAQLEASHEESFRASAEDSQKNDCPRGAHVGLKMATTGGGGGV